VTTIAACCVTGIMASDSQWSDGDALGVAKKVFRIRGALIGFAGELGHIEEVRAWFRTDFKGPTPDGSVTALILRPSGLFCWTAADGELRLHEKQFAIGTGGQAARAAMLAGADPTRACRIACTIDAGSGGRVRTYRL